MLTKVISGGQSGADQAALRAAKAAGIATGGVAPKGWRTETGPAPWLADFGLTEAPTSNYAARTRANVAAADGTLIFEANESPGTALTFRLAHRGNVRVVMLTWCIPTRRLALDACARTPADIAAWIGANGIRTLNVAGHRETVCPGIGAGVERYMGKVFAALAAGR